MASIPYKIVQRKVFIKNVQKTIYTPKISSTGKVTTKSLAAQVAVESTISENEAKAFVKGFVLLVQQSMLNGLQIKWDKLGTFAPTFKSKACDEASEVSAATISDLSVAYTPSVTMENKLKEAKFRKINLELDHA